MKTIQNLFGKKESKRSINQFADRLKINEMLIIKGGDGDKDGDDDWPPTGTGSNVN